MKKFLRTGKKALSVFMAVMMVLTAWVFFEPTKASADNGSYYVKITWAVTNDGDIDGTYTGKGSGDNTFGFTVTHTSNNGRGSSTGTYNWNLGPTCKTKGNYTATATVSGFPTEFYARIDNDNWGTDKTVIQVTKIECGSSASNLKTLWSGTAQLSTYNNPYSVTISPTQQVIGGNDSENYVNGDNSNWIYPYVPSANTIYASSAVANIGIPPLGDSKDVSISTRDIRYYAYDNYGVRYEPTSYSVSGVSNLTTGSGWSCGNAYTITATSSTTKSTTAAYQTATATLNWNNGKSTSGQHANSTYSFRVYNPRYKVTYNGNGGTLATTYIWAYYNRPINDSTSTATPDGAEKFPTTGTKTGYTFDGIYTASSGGSKIAATRAITTTSTYYAHWLINQYTATFLGGKERNEVIGTSTVNYQQTPVEPSAEAIAAKNYPDGDYDYTFAGWDKEITAIGAADVTYTATYTSQFVEANYDAVDAIIAEAQAIQNSPNYEAIYSEESRNNLQSALDTVVRGKGRTAQDVVDGYAALIREAIDGLGRQKYSVLFINSVDNSIIEMRYPVYYGDTITMPADPATQFNKNEHYVFSGWAPSESGDDITFVSKNMVILANFTKEAHNFTVEDLSSNCTTQAGKKYTCSCGYSYVEYSGSVGTEHDLSTEWTIDIEPTCVNPGSKSHHCSRCSYRGDVTEIPALGHDYTGVDYEEIIAAGCDNEGAEMRECTRCGYNDIRTTEATGHDWVDEVIPSSCTENGYTRKSCNNCHDVMIVDIQPLKAHDFVANADEHLDPTCTGLGKDVSYCSACNLQKVETIAATGHTWEADLTVDYPASCTTDGQQSRHCENCDAISDVDVITSPGHQWGAEEEVQKQACEVKGIYVKTCSVCSASDVREVEALKHNYVETSTKATCTTAGGTIEKCSLCGNILSSTIIQPLGHQYDAGVYTPATCTHSGYTVYTCTRSGCTEAEAGHTKNVDDADAPALAHDFTGTETVTKAATCTEDGTKTIACTRCKEVQTVTIPKLGHNYTARAAVPPSCTTSGYTPYTCATCGDTYNVYDSSKPATGHTWGDWTVTKAPTETTDGEQTRTCSVCGATETAPVPATSHTLVEDTTKYVAPTCTADGEKVYKCTATHPGQSGACPYTVTEVVPKLGHDLSTTKTDATCTVDGKVITSCLRCDYKAETVIPATGHSYTNAVTTDPTCQAAGVRTYTCSKCADTYTEAIEKLPHDFVAGTPVAATCTESGYTPYKCKNCDEAYVKITAPAKGHNYAEVAGSSTATCTADGTKTLKCADCTSEITVNVPALGHDYQKTATTDATCAAAATETYTCSRCDANYTISVGDKTTAHDWNEWTVVENATYDSLGYKTRTCKVCGKLVVETIPCLGDHVFDNETGRKDATCTEDGYIDYACSKHSDCGATSRVLLPKTGHDLTTETTAAGCTTDGKVVTSCSKCDYKIETAIPATGHAWGAGVVAKQPTCTAEGEMTYTCSVCSATKTEKIATNPNAHVYTAGAVTPATCVTPELTTYSCACGKSEIKQTAPANGHTWEAEKTVDKEATCIDAGSKSTHCSACEATKDAEVIPATGHSLKTQKVDPTCTTGGYTAEVCENCGYLDSVTAVDPLGHTWNDGEILDADKVTCEKAAVRTYTCTVCNETKREVEGSPLGHDWGSWYISKPATDTEKGEKKRECQRIGCTETETCETPTIGHKWDSGKVTKAATCYEVGTMLYTCTGCENCVAAKNNATLEVEIPKTEHTYTQVTTPATCTADGTTVVKCSVAECGHVAQTVTLPATGHTLERDTANDKAPTCTDTGVFAYKCKNCDYTETITRDALGHDYSTTAVTVTEPTCTTDGEKAYKCTRCDAQIETAIPKTGHDFSITEVIDPTCTEKGYTIKKCAKCTENYVVSDSFVDAAGHNWGTGIEIQAPTTDGYGIMKYVCSKCGAERLETIAPIGDHVFTLQSEVKPGCETTGEKVWVCTAHTDCPANYTEIVPATGHNMKAVQTPATCTTPPYQTWTCQNADCGHSYIVVTGTAIGHNYTKTVTPATCEADGNEHYVCANCSDTYDVVLPKLGHNYVGVVTAPTCKDYGYTTYTCQNDNSHVYVSDYKPTIKHNYVKDDAQSVPATCTSKGYEVWVCTNLDREGNKCGDSYKVITNATGHAYDAGVETTPATCTANGVKTFTCGNCGDTYTEVIPATGHTYGKGVVEREASDGNSGLISYTCSKCNDKFYEEYVINSTEHTWNVEVKQNPTCTEKGVSAYTCINPDCTICAHGVQATFTKQTAALGHDYVGVETTAPTCTETGVMTYTCSRCSDSYDEVIPATGHTYGTGAVTEATCTTAGYTKYTCKTCGYEMLDNYVAPLGHQMDSHVVTAPTCTTAGWTTHSCTRSDCGYSYIDSVTEATGHDYDSAITTEPTCVDDGVKTYTCKNCAADVDGHSYTETVAKTGHAWGEWVTTKNPTATEEGEKTRTCANVNCPIKTETVTLPKLGHTMVAGDIKVQPTCTTTGVQEYVCTEHTGDAACGYTYEVTLPALGHDWNDGEITTAATCTTDGVKTYTCKRDDCGATKTEVVPKTGHDMETEVTEATCVSDKFTTYTCKNCGYSYVINETGTALGHTFTKVVESVDATCEGKGYTIYKCERCDATKTETTEALGHDWGEWKTTTPATCSERGVETRTCKNDPTHIQTRRTNTVDHDFVSTLYHPTCTESGFTILACKGCGKTIRTDFVPAYGHSYDEGVYEDATCTTPGGIRYTCTNINPDGTPCGHSYLVKDTEPLGHIWGEWHYVTHPTVDGAYAKQRDCTRGGCTVIEYERGKMSNEDDINVYYKVEFFNPWTTDTYYELNNGRTKLAKTYKTTKVNEAYYLVGDEVTYPSNILPKREKDYTWGAYKLTDWTYDEVGQTQSALDDMKAIGKNMTVYAEFEGYDVYYKVAFWSEGKRLTIDEVILHGHAAQYPFDPPTKDDNLQYKYTFTGWDYDYTAIYDSVAICAKYKETAKSYNIIYCDWNGTELASETFKYGEAAKNNPTGLTKTADATYIYEFSGKWQTQPGKEEYIDLNHLTVPNSTEEGGTIKVYAKYYQKAKNYTVNIYGYGINKENIPGATVQIFNSSGQIVTTTKLDEESKVIVNLTYDTVYQIMITDDSGNVGTQTIELNTSMKDEETGMLRPTVTTVYLDKYEDPDHGGSDCHCICHSFLGRFWISILNLIYRLTGRKIVCCYDMFATHGDQLLYGQ